MRDALWRTSACRQPPPDGSGVQETTVVLTARVHWVPPSGSRSVNRMKRNSPNDFQSLDDLSALDEKLVDKRQAKRADARKLRRNRHYQKQFLKLADRLPAD